MKWKNSLWVVEVEDEGEWYATDSVGLTKEQANWEKKHRKEHFPKGRFRVVKYIKGDGR